MCKNRFLLLLLVFSVACNPKKDRTLQANTVENPIWNEAHNGIWKSTINVPSEINLLNPADVSARTKELAKMESRVFPLEKSEISAFSENGKTYLRFPLDEDEQIYGLGLNFKTVQQRGRIMRLHMDHYGGEDNSRTHAPVPFFRIHKRIRSFDGTYRTWSPSSGSTSS